MAGKREKPEDIVLKIRKVEVLQGQDAPARLFYAFGLERQVPLRDIDRFFDSDGGKILCQVTTAKINGAEPFTYLKATLEAIAAVHPASRVDELLPWNFNPSS